MAGTVRLREMIVWEARPRLHLSLHHLRVAAYCRVSSRNDAQLSSLENQAAYYMGLITGNSNWKLAGIFANRSTARTMRQRTKFQEMLRLCRNRQIDLILTKSIKRFSRNTLEFLEVCYELKSLGVEVYFELENLYLSNPNSMLLLTIFAGLAQDESKNLSADIRWGIRRGFEDSSSGFINRPCYGYRKSKDGILVICEPEAKVVRQIYHWRADGYSLREIAKLLFERNIPAPRGG